MQSGNSICMLFVFPPKLDKNLQHEDHTTSEDITLYYYKISVLELKIYKLRITRCTRVEDHLF